MAAAAIANLDPATQAALLKNPEVQKAMKNAGEKALADPAVQQAVIDAAKKTLTPENAALVAGKVKDWANDPEVQAKARYAAGMAMAYAGNAGSAFVGCIEQGPEGLRILAFLASIASAVWAIIGLVNVFRLLGGAVSYLVDVYSLIFALSTALFEAKVEWIEKAPKQVNDYQNLLIEYFGFIATTLGRGIFFVFQGSLYVVQASYADLIDLGIGCFLIFIGIMTMLMHFGIMPQNVAAKAKAAAASYQNVPTTEKK